MSTDDTLSTRHCAERLGMPEATFRKEMLRLRQRGTDLRTDPATWPNTRTPMYSWAKVHQWSQHRPGRGSRTDLRG